MYTQKIQEQAKRGKKDSLRKRPQENLPRRGNSLEEFEICFY